MCAAPAVEPRWWCCEWPCRSAASSSSRSISNLTCHTHGLPHAAGARRRAVDAPDPMHAKRRGEGAEPATLRAERAARPCVRAWPGLARGCRL